MDVQTQQSCEAFIANRDAFRAAFPWDGTLLRLAAAGVFVGTGKLAHADTLERCRSLLKARAGMFSNFRSYARLPIIAMLAASDDPEQTLDNGLAVHALLKKDFMGSAFLPLAAMVVAQLAQPDRYEEVAQKTRRLYEGMRAEHPLLTSSDDSAFCALLALSDRQENELITETERCYEILKPDFFSANAVQSLSHVLALYDAKAEEKCERTMRLFDTLKASGNKYATGYELPTLGVLAMSFDQPQAAADAIVEISEWLSGQKGFGALRVSRKTRLLYAGILAQGAQPRQEALTTAAVSATVATLIAQQAAICAAMAASAAATSGSHSS